MYSKLWFTSYLVGWDGVVPLRWGPAGGRVVFWELYALWERYDNTWKWMAEISYYSDGISHLGRQMMNDGAGWGELRYGISGSRTL